MYQKIKDFLNDIDFSQVVEQEVHSFLRSSNEMRQFSALSVSLLLNYCEISRSHWEIVEFLLQEPIEFCDSCEIFIYDIALQLIREYGDTYHRLYREQIYCSIKIESLPLVDDNKFSLKIPHQNLGITFLRVIVCQNVPVEKQM